MKKAKKAIPVPESRVSIKTVNGRKYIYYVTEYYKNKHGNFTNRSVSIGKINPEDESTFFPNANYYELFDVDPREEYTEAEEDNFTVESVGGTAFFMERLDTLGITDILKSLVPDYYEKIISVAIYMASRGNVMLYADDFYDKNACPGGKFVGQRKVSQLFKALSKELRLDFLYDWKNHTVDDDEYVAYDVTSISTNAEDISLAEPGYNRDGDHLPQVNLGVFYSYQKELPICYELYNGSIPDQAYYSSMMEYAEMFDIKPMLYVMDKGFLTKGNINGSHDKNLAILLSIPAHQIIYRDALLKERQTICSGKNYLGKLNAYGVKRAIVIDGKEYTLFVYFDGNKMMDQSKALNEKIEKREKELELQLNKKQRNKSEAFFDVEVENSKLINFERNEEEINRAFDLAGMFGLLTTKSDLSAGEALNLYRQRNIIEGYYNNMKNTLDMRRFYTHSDETTEGKFFVSFIAQILQADVLRVMKVADKKPVPTVKSVVLEMEKVQRIKSKKGVRLSAPLTKKQKQILELFDIDQQEFIKIAEEI